MSINLSIKGVPEGIAARLRARAAHNHRSLQGELMAIIERAAAEPLPESGAAPAPLPLTGASWVQGWKTMDQLVAEREAAGWKPDPRMADLPRAVDIIRADRDRR